MVKTITVQVFFALMTSSDTEKVDDDDDNDNDSDGEHTQPDEYNDRHSISGRLRWSGRTGWSRWSAISHGAGAADRSSMTRSTRVASCAACRRRVPRNGGPGTGHPFSGIVHVLVIDGVDVRHNGEVVRQVQSVEFGGVAQLERRVRQLGVDYALE